MFSVISFRNLVIQVFLQHGRRHPVHFFLFSGITGEGREELRFKYRCEFSLIINGLGEKQL